jgi:hypothetical protein
MKILAALTALTLTAGCASLGQDTVRVEVPVAVPCNPPLVEEPTYPVDALATGASAYEYARAMWATIEMYEAYVLQLRAASELCRNAP